MEINHSEEKSLRSKLLSGVFSRTSRKIAAGAISVGLLVDQFGYAGEYGGNLLDSNSFTRPAVAYYEGFGKGMNFSWEMMKDLGGDLNEIVQGTNQPKF